MTCDCQQCSILTCVDSDEPVQSTFMIGNSKLCSVSSLTVIEYSSIQQRLYSDCAYAQADLRLCWSHIPHCWRSYVAAHIKSDANEQSSKIVITNEYTCLQYFLNEPYCFILLKTLKLAVLPAKSDSGVMFCLQSYQELIIDRSLVY